MPGLARRSAAGCGARRVSSNAEGARRARDERGSAAIASRAAAEIYGLTLLADEIEDRPDNTTRFLVVGRKLFSASGADRTTLLVSASDTDDAGALFRLLEPFAEHRINMTRIESRPSRKRKWDYVFFIDIEGHVSDPPLAKALASLEKRASLFKILGLLSAGRSLMALRRPALLRCAPGPRRLGRLTVPGDKSISHRSILLSALAERRERSQRFSRERGLPRYPRAMRALGVPIEQIGPSRVRVHGVGLRGLKAAPHALDMGNAGTAIRLFTGLLAAQAFDSRLIGDESLMKRPMERVARPLREMGAEVRTSGGTPPIEVGGGRAAARHRLCDAGGERPGEVGHPARRAVRGGRHAVVSPAVCRDHSERMLLGRRREGRERGARHHARSAAAAHEPGISRCPATSPRPRFSSWPDCWRRRKRVWCCKT